MPIAKIEFSQPYILSKVGDASLEHTQVRELAGRLDSTINGYNAFSQDSVQLLDRVWTLGLLKRMIIEHEHTSPNLAAHVRQLTDALEHLGLEPVAKRNGHLESLKSGIKWHQQNSDNLLAEKQRLSIIATKAKDDLLNERTNHQQENAELRQEIYQLKSQLDAYKKKDAERAAAAWATAAQWQPRAPMSRELAYL